MSNSDLETPRDLSTLVGLLKIFFLIVLLNITLYLAIVYFAIVNFHRTVPVFLAFIQFLAFILPIVLILRVGLKEAPAVGPIDNPYLKKIGATPSLVILSCFAAFLATFTPMSAQIFPKPDSFPTSMVAKVGVACRISSDLNASKGAYFLTVIWSDDTEYIKAVRSNLRALQIANSADAKKLDDVRTSNIYQLAEATLKSFMEMLGLVSATTAPAHDETYSQLKLVEKSDQFYKLLKQNTPVGDENSELRWGLSDDLRWAAFTISVKAPEE